MLLNDLRVLQPLRELYDDPTAERTPEQLMALRAALRTVFHENIHLLAEHGASIADDRAQLHHEWTTAVEEGFTNAFAERRLDDFIRGLDLPPRITEQLIEIQHDPEFQQRYPSTYPRYTTAADVAADELATEERGSDETLRQLANRTMSSTVQVATNMLYESSDLPRLVKEPADEFQVKRSIERVLTHHFSWLEENTGRGDADSVRRLSAQRGAQAIAAARWQIGETEKLYRSPNGAALYRAAMTAHRGVPAPSAGAGSPAKPDRPDRPAAPPRQPAIASESRVAR